MIYFFFRGPVHHQKPCLPLLLFSVTPPLNASPALSNTATIPLVVWSFCGAACLCRFLPCPSFLAAVPQRRHGVGPCCVFQSRTGRQCSVWAAGRAVTWPPVCVCNHRRSVLLLCCTLPPPDVKWRRWLLLLLLLLLSLLFIGWPAWQWVGLQQLLCFLVGWLTLSVSVWQSGWLKVLQTFLRWDAPSTLLPPPSTHNSAANQFVVGRCLLTSPSSSLLTHHGCCRCFCEVELEPVGCLSLRPLLQEV